MSFILGFLVHFHPSSESSYSAGDLLVMILHNLSARINKSSLVFVSFNINIVSTHSTGPRLVFLFAHASQCCCCVLPAGEWAMFPVVMVGGGRDTGPGSDTSPPLPSSLTPALQRILPARLGPISHHSQSHSMVPLLPRHS